MHRLEISVPNDVSEKDAKVILAGKLYELGRISLGQAAEMTGYDKKHFIEIMGDYGINYISYPASEINSDISNA